jgi:hypothetical protein
MQIDSSDPKRRQDGRPLVKPLLLRRLTEPWPPLEPARPEPDHVALAARLAKLAYEPEPIARTTCETHLGPGFDRLYGRPPVVWQRGSQFRIQALVGLVDGLAVIAFRGTESLATFVRFDLPAWRRHRPRRHAGFDDAFQAIRPALEAWLQTLPDPAPPLLLTGHSLGGALALLTAFEAASGRFARRDLAVASVIVFGCPRVGSGPFKEAYEALPAAAGGKLGQCTFRYILETDLVDRMPPPVGYAHVGQALALVRPTLSPLGTRVELWQQSPSGGGALSQEAALVVQFLMMGAIPLVALWLLLRLAPQLHGDGQHHMMDRYLGRLEIAALPLVTPGQLTPAQFSALRARLAAGDAGSTDAERADA